MAETKRMTTEQVVGYLLEGEGSTCCAAWKAFLRGLVARGLTGVRLVTSDAHRGLVDAIASTLPRRCLATLPNPLCAQMREARVRQPVRVRPR